MSAHRADLRLHRGPEGGVRGRADLHRPDPVRLQDRPVHLTHAARSRPPSKRSVSDAAVDERILALRDEPLRRGTRVEEDLAPPQRPGRAPPGGPVHRGAAHAGAGAVGGRPRQKAPRHRARRGGPGPTGLLRRDFTATGPNRRWVVDLRPRADPVGVLVARRPSPGPVAPAASSAGPPARARGTDNAVSALEHAIQARKEHGGADLEGLVHHCDHGSKSPVHRLHPTTRPRGDPGPPPEPWDPPTTTPPPKPSTSPTNANSSGATAPGRDAPTPATATARWVDWYNRTRPHLTNDDDLPPTTVEHRYNHNHTTTPPTT